MISLKIYRYLLILLILICVVCIFLLFRSQIFKDKKELQIGAMWFLIILIINFGNMFYTLMYYDKNKDKKGPKGPKVLMEHVVKKEMILNVVNVDLLDNHKARCMELI